MNHILHPALQKRLDLLDEVIDTLERDKNAAGDSDLPRDLEEAKQVQQMAREDYSRGNFEKAYSEIVRSEFCLFFGRKDLARHRAFWNELGEALVLKN